MIEINVTTKKITVSGHANYAPKGSDIVCAAVSILMQTLSEALERVAGETIDSEYDDGNLEITRRVMTQTGDTLIEAFMVGINGIAEHYPDNVELIEAGVEPKRGSADKATDMTSEDGKEI